jgi:hypothetical protein
VPLANPRALAQAILNLKNDPDMLKNIADKGLQRFLASARPEVLGQELASIIQTTL